MANIISTGKNKKFKVKNIKLIVALLIMALAGAGAVFLYIKNSETKQAKDVANYKQIAEDIDNEWRAANSSADYEGSKASLNDKLGASKTPEEKADTYMQLSQLESNNNNKAASLDYIKQADTEWPTYITARIAGDVATENGNKVLALEYYNKALERVGSPAGSESKDYFIMEVKNKIEGLNNVAQ